MVFIICIIVGALAVAGTLWMSAASLRYLEHPVTPGREWFRISPDLYESGLTMKLRESFRMALKEILIWLIALYRRVSRKVTVKQVVKKHVRAFLYDHAPNGARTPSAFLKQVRPPEQVREEAPVIETISVEEIVTIHEEPVAPKVRRPRRTTRKVDIVEPQVTEEQHIDVAYQEPSTHDTDNASL